MTIIASHTAPSGFSVTIARNEEGAFTVTRRDAGDFFIESGIARENDAIELATALGMPEAK